jgi:hypothetical protein
LHLSSRKPVSKRAFQIHNLHRYVEGGKKVVKPDIIAQNGIIHGGALHVGIKLTHSP